MKQNILFFLVAALTCAVISGCGAQAEPSAAPEPLSPQMEAASSPASEAVSPAESEEPAGEEGEALVPISGERIADGTYTIEVTSSSSMFRVVDAQLTAAGGEMTAVLTLSGTGYEKLYMGTGEEALADTDDKGIYFVEDAQGMYTYEVPVPALDQETEVAAWSIRKQTWYDRILVFSSSQLPEEAIAAR